MTQHVTYSLEANLHIFIFQDNTHSAADEYMRLQNEALETWILEGHTEPFCMIVDVSQSGLFPINHTLSHSMSLLQKFQEIPDRYFAYITNNRNDLLILSQLAEGGGKSWEEQRRIFPPNEMNEAKNWLTGVLTGVS